MNVKVSIVLVTVLAICGAQEQDMDVEIKKESSSEPRTCEDLPTNNQHASNPPDLGDKDENIKSEAGTSSETTIEVTNKSTTVATSESTNSTVLVSCKPRLDTDLQIVEVVNATGLLSLLESDTNVTSRRSPAQCLAIMFYASWCPFSCLAAPHFNALPRAFPDIKVAAIDSMKHYSLNTQFGIVGVPTILLFHNGRPTARFNDSEFNLKAFSKFIAKYTGLEPKGLLNVTSADFAGPVSSIVERETDHWLILSWVFVILCGLYFLVQSALWRSLVEGLKNIWREADEAHAEHEHVE